MDLFHFARTLGIDQAAIEAKTKANTRAATSSAKELSAK
jgi:hypothetical protein